MGTCVHRGQSSGTPQNPTSLQAVVLGQSWLSGTFIRSEKSSMPLSEITKVSILSTFILRILTLLFSSEDRTFWLPHATIASFFGNMKCVSCIILTSRRIQLLFALFINPKRLYLPLCLREAVNYCWLGRRRWLTMNSKKRELLRSTFWTSERMPSYHAQSPSPPMLCSVTPMECPSAIVACSFFLWCTLFQDRETVEQHRKKNNPNTASGVTVKWKKQTRQPKTFQNDKPFRRLCSNLSVRNRSAPLP